MGNFTPMLDTAYLEEIYGNDSSFLSIMFESFLEESIVTWDEIPNVIKEKNFQKVFEMAHQIKPSFSMVGLRFLHPKINAFELLAKSNPNAEELLRQYNTLTIEVKIGQKIIEDELGKLA